VVTLVSHYSLIEVVNVMTRIQNQDFLSTIPFFVVPSSWRVLSASYYPVLNGIIAIR